MNIKEATTSGTTPYPFGNWCPMNIKEAIIFWHNTISILPLQACRCPTNTKEALTFGTTQYLCHLVSGACPPNINKCCHFFGTHDWRNIGRSSVRPNYQDLTINVTFVTWTTSSNKQRKQPHCNKQQSMDHASSTRPTAAPLPVASGQQHCGGHDHGGGVPVRD